MNDHKFYTQGDKNLHIACEHASQRKFTPNMQDDIARDCLLDPYILPERLDDYIYLAFLQKVQADMLNDVPTLIRSAI